MFEEDGSNCECSMEVGEGESLRSCMVSSPSTCSRTKKKDSMSRRRFSDDQIKLLETIFESESRLEPRKKLQVATQLGLQPRQVAIWFQNKRARWKSKQLEHELNLLRCNYDALLSHFQALSKEKQGLASQLQKLNDVINRQRKEEDNSREPKSENTEQEEKLSLSFEASENEDGVLSDLVKAEYGGLQKEDEDKLLRIGDGSTTISQENWSSSLDSDALVFPQSNSSYEWWDFWS